MSFNNLVEAHVLSALRTQHGVPMPAIRKAIAFAEREMNVEHLLLRDELRSAHGELFWDMLNTLVNLSRAGQIAMRQLVEAHLRRVERDAVHLPARIYPFIKSHPEAKTVVIDPAVSFGRPTVMGAGIATKTAGRVGVPEHFPDPMVRKSIETDVDLLDYLDAIIQRVELDLERTAKVHDSQTFFLVRTVPGVGKIIGMTLLYEICTVDRQTDNAPVRHHCPSLRKI